MIDEVSQVEDERDESIKVILSAHT